MTNKLYQFWQDLKRRKVTRVITIYAGAAFVILELVDIVSPSLRLPEWTMNFMIVLLCAGFILAVILSWIYDIHPEIGIVKTESADKVKPEDIPKSSRSWKIASYISSVVIVALIVLNIIPRTGKKEFLDKSVAVLPFRNDSPEQTEMYFIDGTMESILDNLCKIKDLRVVSRTSVEQYRNNPKSIPTIGEEMNVSYVVEGSGLRHGDKIRLTIQLIDAVHDQHIWSNTYNRNADEIFELQNEIAQLVAYEIEAVITPEEKELIEKIPTRSTTAFDLYQKAVEVYQGKGMIGKDKALELLDYALDYDSTFAMAYIHKGLAYIDKYNYFSDQNESYLDSVALMIERALHFDPQLAAGYSLKGTLLSLKGKTEEALNSFDRALQLNPNLADAYSGKAWLYGSEEDYVNELENYYQNLLRDRAPANLSENYENIGFVLTNVGLGETALKCYEKMLQYAGDSTWFRFRQAQVYFYTEDYLKAIDIALPVYKELSALDLERKPTYAILLAVLGESSMHTGRVEESYRYLKRFFEIGDSFGWTFPWFKMSIAYSFKENGQNAKASELIEIQIRQSEQWIQAHNSYSNNHYRYLAQAYMLKQDEQQALSYLRDMIRWEGSNALTAMLPSNPIFGPLKKNAEFITMTDQLRANYLKEQERVRQWVEENEML